MFEQAQYFNYFDYEHFGKDFCDMKRIALHFQKQNGSARCQVNQGLMVRDRKYQLSEENNVQASLGQGRDGLFRFVSRGSFVRFYYQHLLKKSVFGQEVDQSDLTHSQENQEEQKEEKEDYSAYTSAYFDRKVQNASLQLGLLRTSPRSFLSTSLTGFLREHTNQYFLYTKYLFLTQYCNFGLLSIFDFSCRNLQTNNLVVVLKPHPKHQIFLRAEVDGLRNYSLNYSHLANYFDFLFVNYLIRPTDTLTCMAELKYDLNTFKISSLTSQIEKRFSTFNLRLKLTNQADITLQSQFPLNLGNKSTINLGIRLADVLKVPRISYGIKLSLNY